MWDSPNLTSKQHRDLRVLSFFLSSHSLISSSSIVYKFLIFYFFVVVVVVFVVMNLSSIFLSKQKLSISSSLDFETQLTIIVDDFDNQLIIAKSFVVAFFSTNFFIFLKISYDLIEIRRRVFETREI